MAELSPRGGWWAMRAPYWLGAVLIVLSLLLATWAFVGLNLVHGHRSAANEARMDTTLLAGVLRENLLRSVEAIDAQLRLLRDQYARDPDGFATAVAGQNFLLHDLTVQISIVGVDGLMRYSSLRRHPQRVDLSDREHVRVQLNNSEDALFISKPVVGRVSGLTTVQFTRKILDARGGLLGVIVISLDSHQLARLREGLHPDAIRLLIVGQDGGVRAAAPATEWIGQDLLDSRLLEEVRTNQTGDYRGELRPGTPSSFVSFRRLERYGLIVVAALEEEVAFSAFRNSAKQQIGVGAFVSLLLVGLGSGLARHRYFRQRSFLLLEENEARLRDFADAAADWFWETDADGRFTYISPSFEKLIGVPIASTIGRKRSETWSDDSLGDSWHEHLDLIRQHKPFRDFTFLRVSDAISPKWVRVSGVPAFARDGTFLGYRGIGRDVSAEVQAEMDRRRWSQAFDKAAFGISIIDSKTRNLVAVNPAYATMHGMTVEELRGYPADRLYAPEETAVLALQRGTEAKAGHVNFEATRLRKDGSRFAAQITFTDVRDVEGNSVYRIVSVLDISENRQMRDRLQQAQKMEAIGQLTAGIAHDFNNLLGAIIHNHDLIIDEVMRNPAAARRHAEDALDAALSGADLVKRLLAFGRQQTMHPQPVDFSAFSDSVLPIIRRTIGDNIDVKVSAASDLWPILADPGQVESALLNLAINARDAMPDGGTLSISARNATIDTELFTKITAPKPGDYVLIAVTDSGVGMAADVVSHAFEPFFTTKGVGKGSGLGLSMVLGSMEQMGGTAKIYSEPGHGTTVTLYLPRALSLPLTKADTRSQEIAPRGQERILVVEDNALIRSSVVTILRTLGYHVEEVSDAQAALTLLEQESRFDLLFTDIVLPGRISGVDLARTVRARKPEVGILLTSGFANPVHYQAQIDELGLMVLVKPYRKAALAERVREMLEQSRAREN